LIFVAWLAGCACANGNPAGASVAPGAKMADPVPTAAAPVEPTIDEEPAAASDTPGKPDTATAVSAVEEPRKVRRRVRLTVFKSFPKRLLEPVMAGLEEELQVEALPPEYVDLPKSAYYPPRKRYRAERLLDFLQARALPGESHLGLTTVDISTTKGRYRDWGIFGLGNLRGRSCIISCRRLMRGTRDEERIRHRIVTTAVHEVGHMLGLPHCPVPRCVMNDAKGTIRTVDATDGHLCARCRARIERMAPQRAVAVLRGGPRY
jgi:archaemetzincin